MHCDVIENETNFKAKVEKLCSMLKSIRLSFQMRVDFKKVQVLLGALEHETNEVTRLDVNNRWNTMFKMIGLSYSFTETFQSLSNIFKHYSKIVTLISIE